MYKFFLSSVNYCGGFLMSAQSYGSRLSSLDIWQYWWWFWFTLLLTFYFFSYFKVLTNLNSMGGIRITTSPVSCGRLGDLLISAFPIYWCVSILTNSNTLLLMNDWKSGRADWILRIYGKQWYWVYKFSPTTSHTSKQSISKLTYDTFYQLYLKKAQVSDAQTTLYTLRKNLSGVNSIIQNMTTSQVTTPAKPTTFPPIQTHNTANISQRPYQVGLGFNLHTLKIKSLDPLMSADLLKNTTNIVIAQKRKSFYTQTSHLLEYIQDSKFLINGIFDGYKSTTPKNFVNWRLLSAENQLKLPTNSNIDIVTTSFDVIHSWYVPGLGIKFDCVPGRTTHHFLNITNSGFYTGQCAEICGRNHHHMPINVYAL